MAKETIVERATSRIVSYASNNKDKVLKTFINSLLLIVIFAMFGCFDFLTLTFHFENLLTSSFWAKVLSKTIAGMCAYNIGINLIWDREIEKDTELEENAKKYEELSKLKEPKSFEKFVVEVFNRKEKKKAYISQINHKIYRLNKISKAKDKLLYSSDLEGSDELRKKNRYCIKRKQLEELKNDEFIEKNIDTIKVRYMQVEPQVFYMELDGKAIVRGVKTKGNIGVGRTISTANVLLGMVGCSMLITILGFEANSEILKKNVWAMLLVIFADIGTIAWQIIRGLSSARKIISSEITQPLIGRNQVLSEYSEWCITSNIEKTKSYLLWNKIESELNKSEVAEDETKI